MDTYTHFGVTGSSYRSPPPVLRHDATSPCYTARRLTRHRAAAAGRRSRRDPVLAPGRTLSTPHPRHGLGNHTRRSVRRAWTTNRILAFETKQS